MGKSESPVTTIPNERFSDIKESIIEKIDNGEIPSMSVAVAENGKIIWMESLGWSDKENDQPEKAGEAPKTDETPTTDEIQQEDLLGRWNGFMDIHDK